MSVPSISLIIPCYNESNRIQIMFEGISEFAKQWKSDFELIIVDDGSNDATDVLIQSHPFYFELKNKNRIILLQQNNTGKGGALKLGVAHASKEFVLTLDADMSTAPIELIKWHQNRNRFLDSEILIGSRELRDSVIHEIPHRKFIGNIFNFIIRKSTGLPFHDTQCGFKLYPTPIAKEIFKSLKTLGWAHDVEVLVRATKKGCTIIEMPITWTAMEGSKINVLKDSWRMFWEVMRIRQFENLKI